MLNNHWTKFNTYSIQTKHPFKNRGTGDYFLNITIKTHTHSHTHICRYALVLKPVSITFSGVLLKAFPIRSRRGKDGHELHYNLLYTGCILGKTNQKYKKWKRRKPIISLYVIYSFLRKPWRIITKTTPNSIN